MPRRETPSRLESESETDESGTLRVVGAHYRHAQLGTNKADPQSAAVAFVGSALRFSIYIHAGDIHEANSSDIERQDQREVHQRDAELGGAIERCIARKTLSMLCPQRARAANERGVEIREVAIELFSPYPQCQSRMREHRRCHIR